MITLRGRPVPEANAGRSHVLDGLRGYAAVAVVFYHTMLAPMHGQVADVLYRGVQSQTTLYGVFLKIALSILNGEVAVYIFFVISGIVLFRALVGMDARSENAFQMSWHFLLRRFIRIWPVMALCLMTKFLVFHQINMIWPNTIAAPSANDLIINLWLIRFPVHGATWTLFVELAAAPIFILTFLAMRSIGTYILAVFIIYSLLAIFKYHLLMFNSKELLGGVPFMLAGIVVASGWLKPVLQSRLRNLFLSIALLFLFANVLFVSAYDDFKLHYSGLLFSITLLVGGVYTARGTGMARFLEAPISQLLGRLSFSLYLWNVPIYELLFLMVDPSFASAHPIEIGLLIGAAAVLISIPVSHYSERWIEQPCISLGRHLTATRPVHAVQA